MSGDQAHMDFQGPSLSYPVSFVQPVSLYDALKRTWAAASFCAVGCCGGGATEHLLLRFLPLNDYFEPRLVLAKTLREGHYW